MAAFLLKAEHGPSYVPPAATGLFGDVPAGDSFAPWIEQLYEEQVTGGCQAAPLLYCPERSQHARADGCLSRQVFQPRQLTDTNDGRTWGSDLGLQARQDVRNADAAAGRRLAALFLCAFGCAAMALAATSFKQPGFSQAVVFSGLTNPDGRPLPARRARDRHREERSHQALPQHLDQHLHPGRRPAHRSPQFLGPGPARRWPWTPTLRPTISSTCSTRSTRRSAAWRRPGDRATGAPIPARRRPVPRPTVASSAGRLSRLTATGSDWTASEHVLLNDWCQQFPSHSIGSLAFGADGYLYMSGGDGASFGNADWGQFGGTRALRP